ncbi:MAG: (4Fe-4S)-binding protein [Cyclobacteriaceae bacterium]|nr:(4Fe-4S)-binding protein [Cyclobacteriaceae bacterium]UYN87288.1 MAG: (4Fe-4S)-binding protein [Cyclobacteriaceae bacterium]
MKDITKKYTNGEVTIVWKPDQCIHSAICFRGLGNVFDPQKRPWVNPQGASTEQIVVQIKKCPSGALSYYMNEEAGGSPVKVEAETIVETMPNGPLMVYGNVTVKDSGGTLTHKSNATAFCRCGGSSNKPYCDGTHKKINFQG